jgi:hypothetical protein
MFLSISVENFRDFYYFTRRNKLFDCREEAENHRLHAVVLCSQFNRPNRSLAIALRLWISTTAEEHVNSNQLRKIITSD